jgi:hypothetical protein
MFDFLQRLRGGIPPQSHDREYGRKALSAPKPPPLEMLPGVGAPPGGNSAFMDAFKVDVPEVPGLLGMPEAPGATGSGSGTPAPPQEHPLIGGSAPGQNAPLPPPRPNFEAPKWDPFAPAYRTGNDESAWVDPRAFGQRGDTPLGGAPQGPGKPGDGVNAFVNSGAPQTFQQPQVAAAPPPAAPAAPRALSPAELPSRDLLNKDGGPTNPQAGFNPISPNSPVANLMKLLNRGFA